MKYFKNGYEITIISGKQISKKKITKKEFFKKCSKNKIDWELLQKKSRGLRYAEFLKSEYWQQIVKKILKRDNYKCTVCESTTKLNVHHTTYKNHYNEHKHLKDLLTLCEKCHYECHITFEVK